MPHPKRSPAQLRNMFGANLRHLSQKYGSISALARELGINRTQFNRYLSGESFPRPDVLARICDFFNVDARVLLESVDQIVRGGDGTASPFLRDFIGHGTRDLSEADFPAGFYLFSRRSFVRDSEFVRGLVFVHREGTNTFLRGYEPKMAMAVQGIPPAPPAREYRGCVTRVDEGVCFVVGRRGGLTASFNFLNRITSFENNFWVGFVTRTVRESSSSTRATRLVYEHVQGPFSRVMKIARSSGFCRKEDLPAYHQRLLQPDDPFR